jgi:hypothetical protein
MNEDQRVHAAFGDQPSGNDGLPERCGRSQHARVVLDQCLRRFCLLWTELPTKGDIDASTARSLVAQNDAHVEQVTAAAHQQQGLPSIAIAMQPSGLVTARGPVNLSTPSMSLRELAPGDRASAGS